MNLKKSKTEAKRLNALMEKLPLEERQFLAQRSRWDGLTAFLVALGYAVVLTATGAIVAGKTGPGLAMWGSVFFVTNMAILPWAQMHGDKRRLQRRLRAHGLLPLDLDPDAKDKAVGQPEVRAAPEILQLVEKPNGKERRSRA